MFFSIFNSIKRKLVGMMVLLATGTLVLSMVGNLAREFSFYRKSLQNQTLMHAKLLAEYCVSPLIFEDEEGLSTILEKIEKVSYLKAVIVFDVKGDRIASYAKIDFQHLLPSKSEPVHDDFINGFLHVEEKIKFGNQEFGSLHLLASAEQISKNLRETLFFDFIIFFGLIGLAVFFANKLQKAISNPILELAEQTNWIANNHDYSLKIENNRNDEIGILIDEYNSLLSKIRNRQKERDAAQEKIKEQYNDFLAIMNAFPEMLYVSDLETHEVLFANEALKKELLEDPVGKKCYYAFHDLTVPCPFCSNSQLLEFRQPIVREFYNPKAKKYFLITNKIIFWPDNREVRFEVAIDITDRVLAEQKIQKMNQDLEQTISMRTNELKTANEELRAFSYSVSHDLRAPLRWINGFSQALVSECQGKLTEDALHYLERIQNGANKMGELIDNLLKLSKITQKEIIKENVNITEIIDDLLYKFHNEDKERKFDLKIEKDLWLKGDRELLEIMLVNLLGNAWKYSSKEIETKISVGVIDIDNKKTHFIKDNGIGFNMKYSSKLFEPFQRLHSNKDFSGTGIGLAIVKRVISKHKGKIWAESEEGKGTTFYFQID